MTFTGMSLLGFGVGLLALAGALYLLQRLRVRHHPLTVETTLFWNDAIEEARARVLVKRFRHPWAYVLVLAIAALLWGAFAVPEFRADEGRRDLFLLDGSEAMAGRFDEALDLLDDALRGLPSESRTVVLCGDVARTVLLPGENPFLLRKRCEDYAPLAGHVDLERLLEPYLRGGSGESLRVTLVGDAPIDEAFLNSLPEGVRVRRLTPPGGAARTRLLTFGQGPPTSARFDRVDVEARLQSSNPSAPSLLATLNGVSVSATESVRDEDGVWTFRWRDLPAEGGRFRLVVDEGTIRAGIILIDHRPLPVAVETGLPDVLLRALGADPGVAEAEPASAVVAVRREGSSFGSGLPALELSSAELVEDAFHFQLKGDAFEPERLRELVDDLGLDTVDGPGLAESLRRTVTVGASPGGVRTVRIWRELLEDGTGFTASATFPVFVARSLRWLAEKRESPRRVAVGEPLEAMRGPVAVPSGGRRDPVGDPFTPRRPGLHEDATGQPFDASVLAPIPDEGPAELQIASAGRGGAWNVVSLVLLLALGLLVLEWVLLRRGSMP